MEFNYCTIIIGIIISIVLFFKLPKLKKANTDTHLKISVIIPARNEEDNLPAILGDLKKQSYNIHEIICVDDNSTDATARIIQEYDAKYIKLEGLPKGWKGKPWACQQGARAATGEILVFLDADVRLAESAISSLAHRYEASGKPVSVQPYHTVKKPHEFFHFSLTLLRFALRR